jgi:SET domain-containing protein
MLTVPVEIKKSAIHGFGVFAKTEIRKGTVLWMFEPGLDLRIPKLVAENSGPRKRDYIMQRGYINPKDPDTIVLCCDEAQFMNFPADGEKANIWLGGLQDGEHILIAAQDIAAGTELTAPPESDADYHRKVSTYGPN